MLKLTIKQQLYGIVGMVVTALVVFSSVLVFSANLRGEAEAETSRAASIEGALSNAQVMLLKARRNEKDYLLYKDASFQDQFNKYLGRVNSELHTLHGLVQTRDSHAALSRLDETVKAYETGFQTIVDAQTAIGRNGESGHLGRMGSAANDLENRLRRIGNNTLLVTLLAMRKHESDFLAQSDGKFVDRVADRKTEFNRLLARSGRPTREQAALRELLDTYHQEFTAVVENKRSIRTALDGFEAQMRTADTDFGKLNTLAKQLKTDSESAQEKTDKLVATLLISTVLVPATIILFAVIFSSLAVTRGLDEALRVSRSVADGNLGLDIRPTSNDEIGQLLSSLKSMDENLMRVVAEVQTTISNIGSASMEIAAGNTNLSQRTEEQASSLEETASSMEEMTGTVKQNADSAAQARQLAEANRGRASSGAEVVTRAVSAMSEINQSSSRIADIIGTIDSIAFQTNLLALNAAVEAARAGEQGRGFAVVASEVRSLAQRSAEAAREIKTLIGDSVAKVKVGTELVDESGQTLAEIISGTQKVADIIAEIASASVEQASGIDQVNNAISQMDNMTQDNAALVEEVAATARSMQVQTEHLEKLISFFRINGQEHTGARLVEALPETDTGIEHVDELPADSRALPMNNPRIPGRIPENDTTEWEQF